MIDIKKIVGITICIIVGIIALVAVCNLVVWAISYPIVQVMVFVLGLVMLGA